MSLERKDVLSKINDIFIEVLDEDDISIDDSTSAKDIEGWDSLTHIQLVVAIENAFKIKFSSLEIQSWESVGEMIDCMEGKGI